MPTRSKYATLDCVIVEVIREYPSRTGATHLDICGNNRVRAFATPQFCAPDHRATAALVSRRLRSLSAHDRVRELNDRWFAAP